MPRLALVNWVLESTDVDGTKHWRPDLPANGAKLAGGKWAVLDLRNYGIDKALLYVANRNTPIPNQGNRRLDLGDKLDTVITPQMAATLTEKLGKTIVPGQTLQEAIVGIIGPTISRDSTGRRRAYLLNLVLMDEE